MTGRALSPRRGASPRRSPFPSPPSATTITIVNADTRRRRVQRPDGPDARSAGTPARRSAQQRLNVFKLRRRLLGRAHRLARRDPSSRAQFEALDLQLDERRPRLGRGPYFVQAGLHRRAPPRAPGTRAPSPTSSPARTSARPATPDATPARTSPRGSRRPSTTGAAPSRRSGTTASTRSHGRDDRLRDGRDPRARPRPRLPDVRRRGRPARSVAGGDGIGLDDAYMVNLYDATDRQDVGPDDRRRAAHVDDEHVEPPLERPGRHGGRLERPSSGIGAGGRAQMYAPNPSRGGLVRLALGHGALARTRSWSRSTRAPIHEAPHHRTS